MVDGSNKLLKLPAEDASGAAEDFMKPWTRQLSGLSVLLAGMV